ncbi:complement C3-like [Pseudophryne corroboree]|uniref:complement C3-like n=1 Tax=Pseudophryne corroboree TaxID=495146 RepID=UPI0030820707
MGCRGLCLVLLALLAGSYAQPCSLIASNLLRMDSEETFILDGLGSAFDANIRIQDFPRRSVTLAEGTVSVNKNNGFLGQVTLTIPSKKMERIPDKKQFVYVTVTSRSCKLEKAILVSYRSGYIFIQTDKPIYTPGSTVYYRIFTMDQNMNPVDKSVDTKISTPQKVIVKEDSKQQGKTGINSLSYELSDLASLGEWTISAKYDGTDMQNYVTHFEVKEYVLPSFEIKLEKTQNVFYLDDTELKVKISAHYLFGKPVNGKAFALFGVKRDNEKKSITESLRRIPISQGEGTATLKREDLVTYFQKAEDMLQWRLYLTVTVITDSGSDMLEAMLDDIYIVTSPYKILFTKTSKYFKPGMPFDFMVFVTNPDGSPAKGVPLVVESEKSGGTTQEDGTVRLSVNTDSAITLLTIKVKTKAPNLAITQQASATMTANAYKSAGGNFLHIGIAGGVWKPGNNPSISFTIKNHNTGTEKQIKHFIYVILNKGKIMKVGRQERKAGQPVVIMKLPITPDYIPSFRIVAYYTVKTGDQHEIVADSIWVDVTDTCMGTLELTVANKQTTGVYEPENTLNLNLKADKGASVGLVAVDKAVYVLNSKYKISQSKVWDSVEKYDIGCTPGSGSNTIGVFHDAGLVLQTSFMLETPQRPDLLCQAKLNRRRRSSAALIQYKNSKASRYTDLENTCCQDGMLVNPMGHSCEHRSRLIQAGQKCIDAFLDCCKAFEKMKASEKELMDNDDLSRSDEDGEYVKDSEIQSRSDFPESWFWLMETMTEEADKDGLSTKRLNLTLKGSITTWEFLAVSLSANKGICVSQPCDIVVRKTFFIDLKLPYSVVRNEQVEIRAILYNYAKTQLKKVRVEWTYNEAFCSLSTSKKKYRQEVTIEKESSLALPFTIVPISLGYHEVEVKASVAFESDGVRKMLKVVPEGRRIALNLKTVTLDPEVKGRAGIQTEMIPALDVKNIVPKTEVQTIVTVQGTKISELVGKSIDGINLNHLISAPGGCGEQNMMRMTPPVIATHYLDATGQWDRVGAEHRAKALEYIQRGVDGQMAYRKPDSSYGIWIGTPSSTWLTAYVVKVFALASKVIYIGRDVLCDSVKWLILNKQKPDGLFQEDAPVQSQKMVGGMTKGAKEFESTLTAFVLIAMLESENTCNHYVGNLRGSINQATTFITEQYPSLVKPYSIAITSYALARAGKLWDTRKLMSASTGNNHWEEPGSHHLSLEATSYALLTLLTLKQLKQAGPLAQWLTEQRFHGEVYGSTQATIMLFQALAQYQIDVPSVKDLEMDVKFKLPGRTHTTPLRINLNNAMLERSDQTSNIGNFTVTAEGKGQGTLSVFSVYYGIETETEKECNNFDLSVTIRDEPGAKKPDDSISSVSIEICTKFLGTQDATMSILEISMMSGYSPSIDGLKVLETRVDRYISNYEVNKDFDRGTLIIYLDKVSHKEEGCIKFNLNQHFRVGRIQPASVTVYDYYSPENRCTKSYHVEEGSKLLGKICYGDVCRCAEENCFLQQQLDKVTAKARLDAACAPSMDYVFKATLTKTEKRSNYDVSVMTIKSVIKQGTDIVSIGESRSFINHENCRDALQLQEGQDYLIWGLRQDLWHIDSKYSYMVTRDTWIERIPTDKECQKPENGELCEDLFNFIDELDFRGCLQ